ncbi:hypothetical protein L202_03219 [Cryptococcus amylolentus CBS 6039]|uniref:Uncharacterized protein n=1 Tax=Cryptococcus amylolentus CBS 6039 TaxID=1295533 RepID=A0A1E3HXT0_9TREE|nr:hypothetical protein L202_03219 [Cryptococcus amylolentus CBS 6039]ODN81128.1 hypothetical protein L202_03219 [Cryptococcus amylolentus CBS 6039]
MADRSQWQAAPLGHPDLLAFVQDLYDRGITNRRAINTRLEQDRYPWSFGSEFTFRRWCDEHGADRATAGRLGQRNIPQRPIGLINGANERWSADGYDKLSDWGFCFYGWQDVYSGQIITMCLLPNNRCPQSAHWVFLQAVPTVGGKSSPPHCSLWYEADVSLATLSRLPLPDRD